MPKTTDQITVDPQGQSMVVDIFDSYGVSVTCYTASGGSSAFTLPATISTATTFYLTSGGYYSVSAKSGGTEIAGVGGQRATVQAAQGSPVTVTPVIDTVEELAQSAASLPTSGGLSVFSDVTVTNGSAPVDITWDPTYAFPGAVPPEDLTGMVVNALDNTLIDVVEAGYYQLSLETFFTSVANVISPFTLKAQLNWQNGTELYPKFAPSAAAMIEQDNGPRSPAWPVMRLAAGEAFRVSLVSAGVTVALSAASWMHVTKVA